MPTRIGLISCAEYDLPLLKDAIARAMRHAGFDLEKLCDCRVLLKPNLLMPISPERAVSDPEVWKLIFEPGFSTAEVITDISGRGVGMDVVKRTMEELRGKIEIDSNEGKGTTFQLRLPLSLALIDGFMVAVGQDYFIMPMEQVDETIDLPAEACLELRQRGYLTIRGEALPCIDLAEILRPGVATPVSRFAVVVRHEGRRVGLAVDRLEGEVKTVIKPLGKIYRDARVISGATILGDGAIALILDLPELLRLKDRRQLQAG